MIQLSSSSRISSEDDDFVMNYFLSEKRIPEYIPKKLLKDMRPTDVLTPPEKECPRCQGGLTECETRTATLFGSGVIWKGTYG